MIVIDAELRADVNRPDLGAEVVLEIELAADVGARRLAVLTHHHECRKEDGFEADNHREKAERELVEDEGTAQQPDIQNDPDAEPDRVEVYEPERAGECGHTVGGPVLGPG